MQKKKLTIEEHAELGRRLKQIEALLHDDGLFNKMGNSLPRDHQAAKAWWSMVAPSNGSLIKLRCALENEVCALVPADDPVWDWSKFYFHVLDKSPRRDEVVRG